MKDVLLPIILLAYSLTILHSCVSTYQGMAFDQSLQHTIWNAIDDPQLHMAIHYDVLTEPGMKPYAVMERKNKVNLVVVTIHNTGQKDFVITRDAVFQTHDGDSIVPLSLEAAMTSLVKPITNKTNDSWLEVDAPASVDILWGAGKATNTAKLTVSHVRFANDMSEHYIADHPLAAGSVTKGLLVLPVTRGTGVTTSMRQRPE